MHCIFTKQTLFPDDEKWFTTCCVTKDADLEMWPWCTVCCGGLPVTCAGIKRFFKSMQLFSYNYCILGIICKRKLSQYVNCHSVREKTFMNLRSDAVSDLVIQLCIILFEKKQCSQMHQDSQNLKHFLLWMIPNIWYLWMAYIAWHVLHHFIRIKILLYKFVIINKMLKWKMQLYLLQHT